MCYNAEFGRSALKRVGMNTGELPKLGSPGTPVSWDGRGGRPKDTRGTRPSPHVVPREIW